MATKHGRPADDASSAPESGTVRDDTSGNQPSDRGLDPAQQARRGGRGGAAEKDDPSVASEER